MSRRLDFARCVFVPRYHVENLPTGSVVYDVSSYAEPPYCELSPMWVHGGIPVPGVEYVTFPVLGDVHWSVRLEGVATKGKGPAIPMDDCDYAPNCNAIVDSGTSMIAVPPATLDKLLDAIGEVRDAPRPRAYARACTRNTRGEERATA